MFSENLKSLREKRGLNKRQAAILLNLPYTTYNNYETGAREPNSEVLVKIAKAFQVSTDYLLDNLPFDACSMLLNDAEREMIEKFRCLPDGVQDAVKRTIDTTYTELHKDTTNKTPTRTGTALESPASLYDSASRRSADSQKIFVAAYGDGIRMHTCPPGREDALRKAQDQLQIDLAIAKRRDHYGK